MATSGCRFQQGDRLAAGRRGQHVHAATLEHADEREDVARVVVDQQHLAADQILVGAGEPVEHALLLLRQFRDDPMQEQRRFVEQALGRFDALDHDAARHGVQLGILLGRQLPAGEHHDGNFRQGDIRRGCVRARRSRSCPAAGGRARRSRTAGRAGWPALPRRCRWRRSRCRRNRAARGCSSVRLRCPRRRADACGAARHIP